MKKKKNNNNNCNNYNSDINIYSLQRSAILGNAHILRKVLSIKPY